MNMRFAIISFIVFIGPVSAIADGQMASGSHPVGSTQCLKTQKETKELLKNLNTSVAAGADANAIK